MANNMTLQPICRSKPGEHATFDALVTTDPADSICLLDDDPAILKTTKRLLVSVGWGVETFTDPDAFFDHVKMFHPHVVMLDMFMPDLDGLEVQRRLSEYSPATRVIVLTAISDSAVRSTALAAGAFAFFVKPARCSELIASIRSAFAASYGREPETLME